jgi:hypothetical protein
MERVLSVLSGQSGVEQVQRDAQAKTVRIRYDEARISIDELVRIIDRTDIRLQAHRHWRAWLGRIAQGRKPSTATVLSDEPL